MRARWLALAVLAGCSSVVADRDIEPGGSGGSGAGGAGGQIEMPDAASGGGGEGGAGGMRDGGGRGGGQGRADAGTTVSDARETDAAEESDVATADAAPRDAARDRPRDLAAEHDPSAPDTAAADGASGGDPESGRLAGITRFHNAVRAKIPVPPLTWDPTIAATATAYAAKCIFEHSGAEDLGENLAAYAPGGDSASAPVDDWAGEAADYNYAGNRCASGKDCGHYTQLVWKASKRLGCAVQTCTVNSPFGSKFPKWEIWVCDYAPPGNFVGQRPY